MQRLQSYLATAVIFSGFTHIFCCGLPLLFSVLTALVGLGVASVLPFGLIEFNEVLHHWEMPILIFSGVILFVGWTLHIISERLDCRSSAGCHHEPCEPKKKKSSLVLMIATVLFIINICSLMLVH